MLQRLLFDRMRRKFMFKMTYKELRSENFKQSMSKLASCPSFKLKVGYNIMRTAKAMEKHLEVSQKEWIEMLNKWVGKDEKGNFKLNADKTDFEWNLGLDTADIKKQLEEWGKKEVLIERAKFSLEDFQPANLTPADLANLEPLLAVIESV